MSGYFTNVCIHYTSTAGVRKEALANQVVTDMDDAVAEKHKAAGYLRDATKGEVAEFAPETIQVEKAAPKPPATPKTPAAPKTATKKAADPVVADPVAAAASEKVAAETAAETAKSTAAADKRAADDMA